MSSVELAAGRGLFGCYAARDDFGAPQLDDITKVVARRSSGAARFESRADHA